MFYLPMETEQQSTLTNEQYTEQLERTQILPVAKYTGWSKNCPNFRIKRWRNKPPVSFLFLTKGNRMAVYFYHMSYVRSSRSKYKLKSFFSLLLGREKKGSGPV